MRPRDWNKQLPQDWELKAKKGVEAEFLAKLARLPEPKASDAREAWEQLKAQLKNGDLSELPWPPEETGQRYTFHADTQKLVGAVLEADGARQVLLLLRITLKD